MAVFYSHQSNILSRVTQDFESPASDTTGEIQCFTSESKKHFIFPLEVFLCCLMCLQLDQTITSGLTTKSANYLGGQCENVLVLLLSDSLLYSSSADSCAELNQKPVIFLEWSSHVHTVNGYIYNQYIEAIELIIIPLLLG